MMIALVACGSSEPRTAPPQPARDAGLDASVRPRRSETQEEIDAYFADPWDPSTPVIDAYRAMKDWMDRMCACRDKACAEEVNRGMYAWSEEMHAQANGRASTSSQQGSNESSGSASSAPVPTRIMTLIGKRYGECMNEAIAR